ncbi:hypothetical protein [Kangiella marina]|uniref:hypothetical protein n=1 Tax=Kangiella marina TaxID=1079178 RepID=UPI0031EB1D1F
MSVTNLIYAPHCAQNWLALSSKVLIFRYTVVANYFSKLFAKRRSLSINFREKINQNLEFRKIHLIAAFFFSLLISAAFVGLMGSSIELVSRGEVEWTQFLSAPLGYSIFSIFYTPFLAPPYLLLMTALILLKIVNRYTLVLAGCIFGLVFWLTLHLTENWLPFSEIGFIVYGLAGALGGLVTYRVLDRNSLEKELSLKGDGPPLKS